MVTISVLSPVLSGRQSSFLVIPGAWYEATQTVSSSVSSYMWELEANMCVRGWGPHY